MHYVELTVEKRLEIAKAILEVLPTENLQPAAKIEIATALAAIKSAILIVRE